MFENSRHVMPDMLAGTCQESEMQPSRMHVLSIAEISTNHDSLNAEERIAHRVQADLVARSGNAAPAQEAVACKDSQTINRLITDPDLCLRRNAELVGGSATPIACAGEDPEGEDRRSQPWPGLDRRPADVD